MCMDNNLNLLGNYIFRRIQKDNEKYKRVRPRESLTGLCINSRDIQQYINDYIHYGIDHMGDDDCADDYNPGIIPFPDDPHERIDKYWDEPDGREE